MIARTPQMLGLLLTQGAGRFCGHQKWWRHVLHELPLPAALHAAQHPARHAGRPRGGRQPPGRLRVLPAPGAPCQGTDLGSAPVCPINLRQYSCQSITWIPNLQGTRGHIVSQGSRLSPSVRSLFGHVLHKGVSAIQCSVIDFLEYCEIFMKRSLDCLN